MRESEDEENSGGGKGAANSPSHSLSMPPVFSFTLLPFSLLSTYWAALGTDCMYLKCPVSREYQLRVTPYPALPRSLSLPDCRLVPFRCQIGASVKCPPSDHSYSSNYVFLHLWAAQSTFVYTLAHVCPIRGPNHPWMMPMTDGKAHNITHYIMPPCRCYPQQATWVPRMRYRPRACLELPAVRILREERKRK